MYKRIFLVLIFEMIYGELTMATKYSKAFRYEHNWFILTQPAGQIRDLNATSFVPKIFSSKQGD